MKLIINTKIKKQSYKVLIKYFSVNVFIILFLTACVQKNAENYFNNGNVKFTLKDYNGAIQDYSKAIELKPDYSLAYYSRAICRSMLGDYENAKYDFNKAIEFKPDYFDAYMNRAFYIKEKTGDYAGAIEDYN